MVHGSPPDLLAEVASNDSAVTLAPPESNVEALQGRSTTSARAPPPALAPLADEPRLSRQPIDQMRRAMPSFVASRQTNAIVPAARLIGELEQTSNLSIRQPLPGLTSPRISGKPPLSKLAAQDTPSVEQTNHGVARRALPGMVPSAPSNDKDSEIKSITQTVQQTPLFDKKGELASITVIFETHSNSEHRQQGYRHGCGSGSQRIGGRERRRAARAIRFSAADGVKPATISRTCSCREAQVKL
ncbi:hypothetical protein FPV67DRAFT_1027883 [Lyophyllum atratum]|nr:hypothetical protein FPV67DRAFT_1027883 [Lyophyllum atratum]